MITIGTKELLNGDGFDIDVYQDKLLISKKLRRYGVLLKPKLTLSDDLLKSLFIIFGDGHYKSKLNLTNNRYRIHNFVLDTFEKELEINRIVWRLRLLHHTNENEHLMKEIKSYWLSMLRFKDEQLYPKISGEILNTNSQGIARIQIDKLTYADVIRKMIEHVINLISKKNLTQREYCAILDGILNAEGSVLRDSEGARRITISFNKDEKILFKNIIVNTINTIALTDRKDRFTINGWVNIYNLLKSFVLNGVIPFSLRPNDSLNLLIGFLNHRRTRALRNYLEVLQKNPDIPFRRLANLSGRDWKSAKLTLQIRTKEFIELRKTKFRHYTTISEEGRTLLKLIRTIEDVIPLVTSMSKEDELISQKLKEVTEYVAN